ncbi:MAG TPA: carboxypeptidase-like regulatory domain-containing protein [Candidatus Eremiobacteraceae bacterium]|nr:carboxypeptidase-like regulatory domain-containing protein [Candidatus Eremiobacteraceae bacterium]
MKLRQLGYWVVIVGLSLPAWAAERPGAISGYVRDASGTPQMGAVVQIAGTAARTLTVFTDGAGFYSATDLLPGAYSVRVSAPSFLPAFVEEIGLHPGTSIHVNVTLNTLLNAIRMGPLRATTDDDDWKWTLRSVANRPVLRVLDDPATSAEQQNHDLRASLSFLAGSAAGGYGSGSDMSTGFSVERSIFSTDRIGVSGNVGYGDGLPAAVLRATYSHRLLDGSGPSMGLTVHRFAPSDPNLHNAALQALALSAGDDVAIGDVLELRFGSALQTIQFLGRVTAFRPYGSLDFHLSPNTVLGYDYATSLPNTRDEKGFDTAPADLSETDPRISVNNFATKLESAHHQELNVSRRIGKNSMQVAVFSDRVNNTALIGAGEVTAAGGFLLPDVYSGTFSYAGGTLDTRGLRVVLERKVCSDLTATLDYAYGGVLDLTKPDVEIGDARQWISTERRHAVAAKLSGKVPHTRTRWIASYRWLNGPALTPVDMFNSSAGQSDPFLNLFIRQPIPTLGFLPAHMEAMVDLRNLLAQGYVPVMGQDGQTVYLVQAARSVRGGVTITF